jgi:hypothetical protein
MKALSYVFSFLIVMGPWIPLSCSFVLTTPITTLPRSRTAQFALSALPHEDVSLTLSSRRTFLHHVTLAATGILTLSPAVAAAEGTGSNNNNNNNINVYFGVGCFWHIQHECVAWEQSVLGRSTKAEPYITSLTGYAGGTRTDNQQRVCYHNLQRIADYGSLGHGEVVGLNLPENKLADFTAYYFSLFDPRTKGM